MHKNSMNKVILVGRIGQDPEKRSTQTGTSVANFSMATNETMRDQSGQTNELTEWHRCVAFGRTADFINSYVTKGRLVYVDGRLRTRKWTDNNNATHYSTEVMVDTIMLLDRREDSGQGSFDRNNINYNQKQPEDNYNQNQAGGQQDNAAAKQSENSGNEAEDEQELPF